MTLYIFGVILSLGLLLAVNAEGQMPYMAVVGSSEQIVAIGNTLTCDEERATAQDCGTVCYNRSQSGAGCPGFYTSSSTSDPCYICHVSTSNDVQNNSFTTFTSDQVLYLLYTEAVTPEVSMDFDHYSDESGNLIVAGINTTGTTRNVQESDFVPGKRNLSLYLHNADVTLSGSGTECWTNFDHCPSGLTMSIWVKPTAIVTAYMAGTGAIHETGVSFLLKPDGRIRIRVTMETTRFNAVSSTILSPNNWYHVVGSYHPADGVSISVNGILEATNKFEGLTSFNVSTVSWKASVGDKGGVGSQYPMQGHVDDFKYYYRVLTPTEVWRDFMDYEAVNFQQLFLSPVAFVERYRNDNTDTEPAKVFGSLKIKLLSPGSTTSNFVLDIQDPLITCEGKGFLLYGLGTFQAAQGKNNHEVEKGFLYWNVYAGDSNNGLNECMLDQQCNELCYYLYRNRFNVSEGIPWKLCQVEFC